jgi:hypothetical protein
MKGHIRRRGERSWELKFDLGRDLSGKRQIRYHSFKGTKREAHIKLAELIAAASSGSYVEPTRITVADFVRARIGQWEASPDGITAYGITSSLSIRSRRSSVPRHCRSSRGSTSRVGTMHCTKPALLLARLATPIAFFTRH